MGNKYKQIVTEINKFCQKVKVDKLHKAQIGITKDPERRLFSEHKITDKSYWWMYTKAENEDTARDVELHFLRMGMKGGYGGGDSESVYVYCFVKK